MMFVGRSWLSAVQATTRSRSAIRARFFAVRLEAGRVEPNRLLRVSGLI
jgi:hypothetical protein